MSGKFTVAAAALLMAISAVPSSAASLVAASPDLVVKFSTSNGRVNLRNIGTKKSSKSVVTIVCKKISGRGSCPDPDPRLVKKYENPAFPNAVTVKFGSIAAGGSKNHVLNFWPSLAFAPGKYRFTLIADASGANAESNEGNNTTVVIKTVP